MRRMVLAMAVLACALACTDGAMAQNRRSSPAPRAGSAKTDDDLPASVPPPVSTLTPSRGISGPRLEPGAVLCRSEEDLERRADVGRRVADGAADAGNPLEHCRLVTQTSAVDIVVRRGLGRTEVKMKPSGETGWTDSYVR